MKNSGAVVRCSANYFALAGGSRANRKALGTDASPLNHHSGWCEHCGCGNDVLGYRHLRSCQFFKAK